jgi:hypothetical protein
MQAIATNINNQDALKTLFVTANLLCKIFYSLNAVDIPEYFEDNMAPFMEAFRKFLHFQTAFPALIEGPVWIKSFLYPLPLSCAHKNYRKRIHLVSFTKFRQTCVTT